MMTTMREPERQSKRAQHAGTRSCSGCQARVARQDVARELVHLVFVPSDGTMGVVVDLLGRGQRAGRGAWVHARRDCLDKAASRGLARAAKAAVKADAADLAAQIEGQATRRATSLLVAAQRAGKLAVGSTPTSESVDQQQARLVLVAKDAAAAAKLPAVQIAFGAGQAVAWGTKAQFGAALGRREVGVMAVLDDGIAEALQHAIGLAETFGGGSVNR
jgi:predicted RNA-binding protein YlxR (DUF448 family)/ribosomal protein L30E